MRVNVLAFGLLALGAAAQHALSPEAQQHNANRRQIARRLDTANDNNEHALFARKESSAKAKAAKAAALKKAAALAAKKKAAAKKKKVVDPKALSALSKKSKSLALKSSSLAKKAASLSKKSKSLSAASKASRASASKKSASLASLAKKASLSAKAVKAAASKASVSSKSVASAKASLSSAQKSLSSAIAAHVSGGAGSGGTALSAASVSIAKSISSAQASVSSELALLASKASVAAAAQSSLSSLSHGIASQQASVSQATASLAAQIAQVTASLASVGSSLDSAASVLATSTSVLGVSASALLSAQSSFSSASAAFAADGAAVTQLAGQLAGESAALGAQSAAIVASAAAAAASATAAGLSKTCKTGAFLVNGRCLDLSACPSGTTLHPTYTTQDWSYCCNDALGQTLLGPNGCTSYCPNGSSGIYCCADANARSCSSPAATGASLSCGPGWFLNNAGNCVTASACTAASGTPDRAHRLCCTDAHAATCSSPAAGAVLLCQGGYAAIGGVCTLCVAPQAVSLDGLSCVASAQSTTTSAIVCEADDTTQLSPTNNCLCAPDYYLTTYDTGVAYCMASCGGLGDLIDSSSVQINPIWDASTAQSCRQGCAQAGAKIFWTAPAYDPDSLPDLPGCNCWESTSSTGGGGFGIGSGPVCDQVDPLGVASGHYGGDGFFFGSTASFPTLKCPTGQSLSISGSCVTSGSVGCANPVSGVCCPTDSTACLDPVSPTSCISGYTLKTVQDSTACLSDCIISQAIVVTPPGSYVGAADDVSYGWSQAPATTTTAGGCAAACAGTTASAWAANFDETQDTGAGCYCWTPIVSSTFDLLLAYGTPVDGSTYCTNANGGGQDANNVYYSTGFY